MGLDWFKDASLRIVAALLLILVFLNVIAASAQPQLPVVQAKASEGSLEISSIIGTGLSPLTFSRFDELEEQAQAYRASKETVVRGDSKLELFYDGLRHNVTPGELKKDPKIQNNLTLIREWIEVKPQSVTARIALADALLRVAWYERGSLAYEVSQERKKVFNERLDEIRLILREAKKLPQKCPYWWVVAQNVGLAQKWDKATYNAVYQEALDFSPDFDAYYLQKAGYLHINGDRENGEWLQYAQDVTDAMGGERGDILYVRIIWHMEREGFITSRYLYPLLSTKKIDRGFEALLKAHPNNIMLLNGWALLAAYADSKETFEQRKALRRELFMKIGAQADSWIWPEIGVFEAQRDVLFGIPDFFALGVEKVEKGQYEAGLADLNQAIERSPRRAEAYDSRGVANVHLQRFPAAIKDFNWALSIDPKYAQTYINRSYAYSLTGKWKKALADGNKAVELLPESSDAYLNRGIAKYRLGDAKGADTDFQAALERNPESYNARYNAGQLKASLREYQAAVDELNILLEMEPEAIPPYSTRAFAYYHLRQWQNSLKDFRTFLKLSKAGDNTLYQRYFVWQIMTRQRQKEAATTELKTYLNTLVASKEWSRQIGAFLVGQLAEEALFQVAQDTDPQKMKEQQTEAYYYAGMKRLFSGDKAMAREYLQKVLDSDLKDFTEVASAEVEMKALKQP